MTTGTAPTTSTRQKLRNLTRKLNSKSTSDAKPGPQAAPEPDRTMLKYNTMSLQGYTNAELAAHEQAERQKRHSKRGRLSGLFSSSKRDRNNDESTSGSSNTTGSSPSMPITPPTPQIRPPAPQRLHSAIFASSKDFKLPDLPWLCGTWFITHSTRVLWQDKHNVRVHYIRKGATTLNERVTYEDYGSGDSSSTSAASSSSSSEGLRHVSSQKHHEPRVRGEPRTREFKGTDSVLPDGSYIYRPSIRSIRPSALTRKARRGAYRWEVLGWGGGGAVGEHADIEQWVVTYTSKTVFAPAGIEICARTKAGLSEATLGRVINALRNVERRLEQEAEAKRAGAGAHGANSTGTFSLGSGRDAGNTVRGREGFGEMLSGLMEVMRDNK